MNNTLRLGIRFLSTATVRMATTLQPSASSAPTPRAPAAMPGLQPWVPAGTRGRSARPADMIRSPTGSEGAACALEPRKSRGRVARAARWRRKTAPPSSLNWCDPSFSRTGPGRQPARVRRLGLSLSNSGLQTRSLALRRSGLSRAKAGRGRAKIMGFHLRNCLKGEVGRRFSRAFLRRIETGVLKSESRTAAFLAMNPAGQVPAVLLDDGRPLAQSNAIILHLAEGSALSPRRPLRPGPDARMDVLGAVQPRAVHRSGAVPGGLSGQDRRRASRRS